ncbi:MAG: hypothetical protein EBZ48_00535, partial [Proteobacteria bacterium]|nr:hypothetical protein [Pseudomonadota bacterium]
MTDEERYILTNTAGRCVEGILRSGAAVYLEGLGILFPEIHEGLKSYTIESKLAVRRERSVSINFEKCSEIVSVHRERFGIIVESRE